MSRFELFILLILLTIVSLTGTNGQTVIKKSNFSEIIVEWHDQKPIGKIEILNGTLSEIRILVGKGEINNNSFEFRSTVRNRISITFDSVKIENGARATVVTLNTGMNPFSFFLRDVNDEFPIYISEYKVVVLKNDDSRSYEEVETEIKRKNLASNLEKIEAEPEESFESIKYRTRNQSVPTWLGISRDIRIFQISQALEDMPGETDVISPRNSSQSLNFPSSEKPINYLFATGRGQGVEVNVQRRLESGVLPILHSDHTDGEISYKSVAFASLESSALSEKSPIGTDFLIADSYSAGHMITDEQQKMANERKEEFIKETNEQTVLYYQVAAKNIGKVPRYAWYKTPRPGRGWWDRINYQFNPKNGFSKLNENQIFCISKLNGQPLPNEEMAILLQPGEAVTFEFYIPHSPISEERAAKLAEQLFDNRYSEAKKFWQNKLDKAAQIRLPEKRIEEMIQAGLLHLDLITYGKEPEGTLAPLIGIYSPIGTESSPIIQFYCSMGWNDVAKRSLMYFLDKQHDDGLIQNFGGYMVETGAALWSMGEYFRYSNDVDWVKQVKPKLLKSCDYLLNWRECNKKGNLKGRGFGMIDGKVADPEDPYHQYMLNGYAYLGIIRIAEMLKNIDPTNSTRLEKEAESWKRDILESFYNSMARSPAVPLGDGTWCPTVSPWTEAVGLRALFVDNQTFFSHGTFTAPDAMLGPLYLVFCEVLEPDDPASKTMLNYHSDLFYQNNSAFSQPYYSRHNWMQLKLGLVKPFLKTYYNTFSATADRETYTFWEHLYHASPHKTHEEGWFLMQTRWMLYLENGKNLDLLPGIPRWWLNDGEVIELTNVATYFGPLTLKVESHLKNGYIEATINCDSSQKPEMVYIRLPHPEEKKAIKVIGGIYDEESEKITVNNFSGTQKIRVEF